MSEPSTASPLRVYHSDGREFTAEEADRLLAEDSAEPFLPIPPRSEWKEEKECALCGISWNSCIDGYTPKQRVFAGQLICDRCLLKNK